MGQFLKGAGPREYGGPAVPSISKNQVNQSAVPVALKGREGRSLALRILFVHSDPSYVERCVAELRKSHFKVSADIVLRQRQFSQNLNSKYYDLAIVEHPTPNWDGSPVLNMLRLMNRDIPCIFVTETVQLETMAELMTEGAADCVSMGSIGHLPIAIRRVLSENNLRKERDQTEKKLRHSEARYRALIGNLTYGICRCNDKGVFLNVNQALVTMLGYNAPRMNSSQRTTPLTCSMIPRNGGSCSAAPLDRLEGIRWKLTGSERMERHSRSASADAR